VDRETSAAQELSSSPAGMNGGLRISKVPALGKAENPRSAAPIGTCMISTTVKACSRALKRKPPAHLETIITPTMVTAPPTSIETSSGSPNNSTLMATPNTGTRLLKMLVVEAPTFFTDM
jgi:hypothetical protein